jgi:ribosomal protein S18 acetylase RimI-like enzyme
MREAFMDTPELVKLLANPVLLKSFNALLNDHGDYQSIEGHFTLNDVIANFQQEKRPIMYYIIWTPDTIVFTSRMFLTPKTGYITMVHTHDGYKRRGICSGAFNKIFKHFSETTRWKLDVEKGNQAAIACYTKMGFKATAKQPIPYAIVMILTMRKKS